MAAVVLRRARSALAPQQANRRDYAVPQLGSLTLLPTSSPLHSPWQARALRRVELQTPTPSAHLPCRRRPRCRHQFVLTATLHRRHCTRLLPIAVTQVTGVKCMCGDSMSLQNWVGERSLKCDVCGTRMGKRCTVLTCNNRICGLDFDACLDCSTRPRAVKKAQAQKAAEDMSADTAALAAAAERLAAERAAAAQMVVTARKVQQEKRAAAKRAAAELAAADKAAEEQAAADKAEEEQQQAAARKSAKEQAAMNV